jgi:Resolvase, N terminal domain
MDYLDAKNRLSIVTVALAYARLSRDRRKKSENVGIQLREDRLFIEDQEWEHGGEYKDRDITASEFGTKTRDDYLRMVEDIKNWPDREGIEIKLVIVVTEMPRLYRQLEGYDLSTPEGYHRAVGAVNNARLESMRASKRQLRKKLAQAAQDKYMSGQRRYGFEGPIKDEHGNIINRDRINIAEVPEEIAHWFDWFNRILATEPLIFSPGSAMNDRQEPSGSHSRTGRPTFAPALKRASAPESRTIRKFA